MISPPAKPITPFFYFRLNLSVGRLRRVGSILFTFFLGQGFTQVIGLITGFLLIRWLTVEDYAKTGLAFSFQCVTTQVVDLGFSSCIIALAGPRGTDPAVLGSYIKASKFFRSLLLLVVLPVAFFAFCAFSTKHGWDWPTRLILFSAIGITLWFQGVATWYGAPLLIHQKLTTSYRVSVASSLFRLAAAFALHLTGALVATSLAVANAASGVIGAFWLKSASRPLVCEPTHSDPAIRRQMVKYLAPEIPLVFFFAFQGQITVFVISAFGKTSALAEVSALGRLSQIFTLLSAIYGTLVLPYFARVPQALLPRRYAQLLLIVFAFCVATTLLAFAFPEPLLWLLGKKYAHLRAEVGWMVLNACFVLFVGAIGTVNSARRWVYWGATFTTITVMLAAQICGMVFMDLSTTLHVMHFAVLMSTVGLLIYSSVSVWGLLHPPLMPDNYLHTPV